MSQLKELLKIRDFRRLWLAQVGSNFGDSLTSLTLLILIQRLTGSTVALAGLMIAITLPALIFGTIAGVYVDRFDRKRAMIISDAIRAVLVLGFLLVQSADLIPFIYVIAFAQAAIGTFFRPARGALMPRIVGTERLLAANSVSQTSMVIFNVLGTAAAGILASLAATASLAFIVDSATFLVSALLVASIRTTGTPEKSADGKVWAEMAQGFKVMFSSRPLKGVLTSLTISMLGIGAVNVLLVPLLLGELQVSEAFFGAIEAAQVAGMVLSGGAVAILAAKLRPSSLISVGLIGVGIGVGSISGMSAVWQLMILIFWVGLSVGPAQAGVATLSQTLVEDSMRGRVGGVMSSLISGAQVLSMGLAGVAAAAIGTRNVFLAAGVLTVAAGVLAFWFFYGLSADEQRRVAPAPELAPESA